MRLLRPRVTLFLTFSRRMCPLLPNLIDSITGVLLPSQCSNGSIQRELSPPMSLRFSPSTNYRFFFSFQDLPCFLNLTFPYHREVLFSCRSQFFADAMIGFSAPPLLVTCWRGFFGFGSFLLTQYYARRPCESEGVVASDLPFRLMVPPRLEPYLVCRRVHFFFSTANLRLLPLFCFLARTPLAAILLLKTLFTASAPFRISPLHFRS